MICPECQSKTTVVDSRTPGESVSSKIQYLLNHGERLFGWWSDEFRMRRRKCCDCGETFETIEITMRDLEDSYDEVQRDPELGKPWREDDEITEETATM